ncbi:MAG: SGNH/GDSL hydrolase family protein [Candidatus Hydrogenedentes bacterium]|nr:SGNH/GDSL hydrolase family protein [Candidatus Hydrogenedentota bacterium]
MTNRRRILTSVLAGLLPAILLASLIETGARLLLTLRPDPLFERAVQDLSGLLSGSGTSFRFISDPRLAYRLKPDFLLQSPDGGITTHNEAGFRTTPFDENLFRDTTFRLLCIGGSTTYGVAVTANETTYPAQLEALLARVPLRPPFKHVRALNLGVGGYTTQEMKETLRDWIGKLKPHAVLIHCGVNDVAPRLFSEISCDYSHFRKPLKLPRITAWQRPLLWSRAATYSAYRLGWIQPLTLQTLTQKQLPRPAAAAAALGKNGPECFRQNVIDMVKMAQDAQAKVLLITEAYLLHPDFEPKDPDAKALEALYQKGLDQHSEALRELTAELNCGLADLARDFPLARWLFVDPIHLNKNGNTVKARLIAHALFPDHIPKGT